MLNREFDRFGAIKEIDFSTGAKHAFVIFESQDAASAAHSEMRGFPLGGTERKIQIDYAEISPSNGSIRKRSQSPPRNSSDAKDRGNRNGNRRSESRKRSRSPSHSSGENVSQKLRAIRDSSTSRKSSSSSSTPAKTDNAESESCNGYEITVNSNDSLLDIAKHFPIIWRGAFALKNSAFPVRMHAISGNTQLATSYLQPDEKNPTTIKVLSITQRLRLEPTKLDEISRRVKDGGRDNYCILLALPTGDEVKLDASFIRRPLKSLVTYFKKKEAAGVIMLNENATDKGMLHAFPPCEFSLDKLCKLIRNLNQDLMKADEDHVFVVVVKGAAE